MSIVKKQLINDKKVILKICGESKMEVCQTLWAWINNGRAISIRPGVEICDDTPIVWQNIQETEGYVTASIPEFIKTLTAIELMRILNKFDYYGEKIPVEFLKNAERRGLHAWKSIEECNILNPKYESEMLVFEDP